MTWAYGKNRQLSSPPGWRGGYIETISPVDRGGLREARVWTTQDGMTQVYYFGTGDTVTYAEASAQGWDPITRITSGPDERDKYQAARRLMRQSGAGMSMNEDTHIDDGRSAPGHENDFDISNSM